MQSQPPLILKSLGDTSTNDVRKEIPDSEGYD